MVGHILYSALVTALVLWVEHWLPWKMYLRRELPTLVRYVIGVLAMVVPYSAVLICWGRWDELIALWAIIASGGIAVFIAYAVDDWRRVRIALLESLERERMADDQNDNG